MGAKIGNRIVVHTESLIIPAGEDGWIDFHLGKWHVKVNLVFEASTEKGPEEGIRVESVEDYARIVFVNWNNILGTATPKPVEVGRSSDGQKLLFMVSHVLLGGINRLDIQFMLGGA